MLQLDLMAGIYIHIPYCKQACHYCDFHFSTNQKSKDAMIRAMLVEIEWQKGYLNEKVSTIYFGGGTPSLLSGDEITTIIDHIYRHFECDSNVEITLEANPDDLTLEKLRDLKNSQVNRLSIGIQTFDEERLKYINRAHHTIEAVNSVKYAQDIGFTNLSIDLIYAIPPEDMGYWQLDLSKAIQLDVPHISLYGLTIEPKTAFGVQMKKGLFNEISEDTATRQYKYAIDFLKSSGYEHYEVANFSKPGFRSKHNNAYWNQKPYLGIGPGAHSFNGDSRQYNIRNNGAYIKSMMEESVVPFEKEMLSPTQKINEFILTRLRTSEGIDLSRLLEKYSFDMMKEKPKVIRQLTHQGLIEKKGESIVLSLEGLMVADEIALILFLED
ncbi:MAG: radical SAM family heme chaperone HemW [Cyclobacteriaceae bacterium]